MKTSPLEGLINLPSPLQSYSTQITTSQIAELHIKRDDLIHPQLSGNKIRKLKRHIQTIQEQTGSGILTMGGPWSNHLHACSWLCQQLQVPCTLLVRGHKPKQLTLMLQDALRFGAQIEFIGREDYRNLRLAYENDTMEDEPLISNWDDYYFIPEGGRHQYAVAGFAELAAEIDHDYDAVYMAVGTGTSIASLAHSWTNQATQFHGILALDARLSQQQTIDQLLQDTERKIFLRDEFLFGGYAKSSQELRQFIAHQFSEYSIPLEPVYTAKAFYGMLSDISAGRYDSCCRLLFIHTGGMQGVRGYSDHELSDLIDYYTGLENLPFQDH